VNSVWYLYLIECAELAIKRLPRHKKIQAVGSLEFMSMPTQSSEQHEPAEIA
jgi:hypothetical protein